MNQTWEKSKQPNFEIDFGPFGLLKLFFVDFTSTCD